MSSGREPTTRPSIFLPSLLLRFLSPPRHLFTFEEDSPEQKEQHRSPSSSLKHTPTQPLKPTSHTSPHPLPSNSPKQPHVLRPFRPEPQQHLTVVSQSSFSLLLLVDLIGGGVEERARIGEVRHTRPGSQRKRGGSGVGEIWEDEGWDDEEGGETLNEAGYSQICEGRREGRA